MCAGLGRWWAKCAKTACCPKVFLYSYTRTLGQNSKMTHLGHFWRNRLKVLNAPHSRAWKSAHSGLTRSVKTDLPNGLYRVETLARESDALFTGHFSPTLRFAFKTSAHVQVNSFGEERSFAAFRMPDALHWIAANELLARAWLMSEKMRSKRDGEHLAKILS